MKVKDRSGFMTWKHGRTWFRVIGDLKSKQTPIVLLHGGPGGGHLNMVPIAKLLSTGGRPVILYDQIGCGKSTPLIRKPNSFWTVQLFEDELTHLLRHLKIEKKYLILGTSWGGMLAMSFASKRPTGLKGLILSSTLPSSAMWIKETRKLINKLPAKHRSAINKYEKLQNYTHKDYLAANTFFMQRHIRQIPALYDKLPKAKFGKHVYNAMWGPTEFTVLGSLRDWSVEKEISKIKVPTFIINGELDEATPAMQRVIKSRIKGSQYYCIKGASHSAYIEAPLEWMNAVQKWFSKTKL